MKSVLVIETPRNCDECFCSAVHQDIDGLRHMCRFTWLELTGENMVQTRPKWCPLKPMPEKQDMMEFHRANGIYSQRKGWNACLEEILGETECQKKN